MTENSYIKQMEEASSAVCSQSHASLLILIGYNKRKTGISRIEEAFNKSLKIFTCSTCVICEVVMVQNITTIFLSKGIIYFNARKADRSKQKMVRIWMKQCALNQETVKAPMLINEKINAVFNISKLEQQI